MTTRLLALVSSLVLVASLRVPARSATMPVDEIQPGMVGTGVTVFEGTRREEFTVRILGVLRNVIGPRRDLILARLEGGPLEKTGVIAGMSGSPVVVDGRLVGAVSYSLGAFSREAIAGITPIGEMFDAAALETPRRSVARRPLSLPVSHEAVAASLRDALPGTQPFAASAGDVRATSGQGLESYALELRPIATPLAMAGFSSDARELLGRVFGDAGLMAVSAASGSRAPTAPVDTPLAPGDAVGVSLVGGDLSLGATGTVTAVDGSRVYAFGHPFLNLGPTAFPMTRSYVHAVLPSLFNSVKVASVGEIVGAVRQDRATTIAGDLGPAPATVPLRVSLEREGDVTRKFEMSVANDQFLTPLLTFASLLSVLQSYEREFGTATFAISGEARVKGHGPIALEDVFTGDAPSASAASYVVTPITLLLRNDVAPVEFEGVNVTIKSAEEPRWASLERVWVDAVRIRPGDVVPVKVLTRSYRGDTRLRTIPVAVPSNAQGTLTLMVSDGARLTQWEQREWRQALDAQTVEQMIRVFNMTRKNNRLYVRLVSPQGGAVVNGELLPNLPASVLSVYEADRATGGVTPTRSTVLGEWDVQTDHAIRGSRQLSLTIESR